jgi:hypothetical protein
MQGVARLTLLGPAILASLFLASPTRAAWPTNPAINAPVSVASGAQLGPVAAPDSCGGMIVAWRDVPSSGPTLAYVQRVDALGQPRWTLNGFAVAPTASGSESAPSICSDGAGGAFVTWAEQRLAVNGDDVYLQHALSIGMVDPAWPVDGLLLTNLPANQQFPEIVADGVGGAIVVWADDNGGSVDLRHDLYAQRVSPTGTMIWAVNGMPLVVAQGDQLLSGLGNAKPHVLASDGGGGVIAAWEDSRTGVKQAMGQRLSAPTGAPMWTPGGVAVAPTLTDQTRFEICADGARAILTWEDNRSGPLSDIYAQALSPGGVPLWAPSGNPVCTAVDLQFFPHAVTDGLGGAIIAWADDRSGSVLTKSDNYAQRLDASGTPLWTPNGVGLCTQPGEQPVWGLSQEVCKRPQAAAL